MNAKIVISKKSHETEIKSLGRSYRYLIFIILMAYILTTNAAEAVPAEYKVKAQLGHSEGVKSVDISSDGFLGLTGSKDATVKLWDLRTGKEMRVLKGHSKDVTSVKFSPDGKLAVSGSEDKTIKLWNIVTGSEIKTFSGHNHEVNAVSVSNDGKFVLSGSSDWTSNDHTIKLWDIVTGEESKTFYGHSQGIISVDFSPCNNKILSSSNDDTTKLWDIKTGSVIYSINNSMLASFSPDGEKIISRSSGKNSNILNLYESETGKIIKTIPTNHSKYIFSVEFSANGKYIVTGSADNTSELIELETGTIINTFTAPKSSAVNPMVNSAVFSPDDKYILCSTADGEIIYRESETGKIIHSITKSAEYVYGSTFSKGGSNILLNSYDRTLKLFNKNSGKILKTFQDKSIGVSATISNDGKYILKGCQGIAKLWDINSGELVRTFGDDKSTNWFHSALSQDGRFVVSTFGNYLALWDFNTGEFIRTMPGHEPESNCLKFTPDSRSIIASSPNKAIWVWDVTSGKVIRKYEEFDYDKKHKLKQETGHSFMIVSIDISSDGKYAVSGSEDKTIKLWNFDTGNVLKTFSGHKDRVNSVSFSSDGQKIVSGSNDKTVKFWDISSVQEIKTYAGHDDGVSSVEFSPDDRYILSSSWDNTIKIWDILSGNSITYLFHRNNKDWLMMTNDGYWDSSPNGGELVAMISDLNSWNIDQFAVKNNRPDIILERLGSTDKELISHYYQQYQKRLRKLGLTEDQLSSELHVPVSTIESSKQEGKLFDINFSMSDSKYQLKRYNIYVNDVPLFGSYGKGINGSSATLSEKIELTQGTNKIEISCMNEKGAESYRALTYAEYQEQEKGDLYYLAFGVSQYKEASLNLKYADKDANDLSEAFSKLNKDQYSNIYVKTFLNEQATLENIRSAKDFLKSSKPDDTFILFIAGHGVHDTDKEATYYFLTHETDLSDLPNTAANFELIEDILQGIPPRNKLFLMDTCESGEIEEGVQNNYYASADSRGLKGRGIKVVEKASIEPIKAEKRTYLYEKDRYIYNDLARRSGAIVFSSSKGGELSYEKDEIQNGLFTEEIIKCLASKEADKDKNGIISTDELRDYVSKAVAASSGGLQNPTVDRDNIYQKFGFGIEK